MDLQAHAKSSKSNKKVVDLFLSLAGDKHTEVADLASNLVQLKGLSVNRALADALETYKLLPKTDTIE